MAKVHKRGTRILAAVMSARGGVVRAVRSDGHIIASRGSGRGHSDLGMVKGGMTLEALALVWERRHVAPSMGANRVVMYAPKETVPLSVGEVSKRLAAKAKRVAKQSAADDVQRAREAECYAGGFDIDGFRRTVSYLVSCARNRRSPLDGRLHYACDMARFHGGATGGYLGTAINAQWYLPEGTHSDARENLDTLADMVARVAFGTDTAAAEMWGRALRGDV